VLLLCGIVLFELTLLVLVRAKKGLPWWKGSPDHFSLRLQAAGLSRWGTDIVAWSITTVLCGMALMMDAFSLWGQIALLAAGALGLLGFGLLVLRWDVPPK
jgi:UDP-GlcNAc:undecaprenyl-phosphate GlcNAc-1-phosphate transferase